ncbi:DUF5518 domain-containing protein [Halobacterium litoreum]|uniref:DUF5518 domain-containing protein n=1 Tax=Halobacterium litoreum TaxID=2039234 RepID=A0ABD5NBW9_9EURY|nr:DUF5518 domain-containing protein [Halobacterium litoreum]UHH14535.1 DUF5518 domain-containing protein [Halobacterium litoreum]
MATADSPDAPADEPPILLRKPVDWLVGVVLVLFGLGTALAGLALRAGADRDRIAEMVAEGTLRSDVLTEAELVDATHELARWGGFGAAATGAVLVLAGVGYVAHRSRVRGRPGGTPDTVSVAVLGAVVTGVTSFVPVSPVVGGGVAGYLHDGDGTAGVRVGGAAGLVAAVPLAVLFGFLAAGLAASGNAFVAGVLAVALGVSALFVVALSALGGYLGVYLRNEFAD